MQTRVLRTVAVLATALFFQSCGQEDESFPARKRCATKTAELGMTDGGFSPGGTSNRGLLLSTTEDYKSSRLFFFDFNTGQKTQLMSGESGDPGVFTSRGETFFINRTADNSNLRSVTIGTESYDIGKQTAIPGAGTGDPQSIMHIDDRHLVMSFWASSKLGVFDLEECELVNTFDFKVDLDWEDGDVNRVFRPSTFVQIGTNAAPQTYVIHQGIDSDGIGLNGSQQIFALTWDGKNLGLEDNDTNTGLIQGIPLKVSNPTAAFVNGDNTINVVGSCTIFTSKDCVHGIETVDLVNKTSAMTFDFSGRQEKNNGSVVAASDQTYFMQMIKPGAAGDLSDSAKFVAKINLQEKTIEETYTYPNESNGCCGLFYESSSKKLIVTDYTPTGGGELFYIDENKLVSSKISVENTPYSGIILSN
jgi:hypothetical protein